MWTNPQDCPHSPHMPKRGQRKPILKDPSSCDLFSFHFAVFYDFFFSLLLNLVWRHWLTRQSMCQIRFILAHFLFLKLFFFFLVYSISMLIAPNHNSVSDYVLSLLMKCLSEISVPLHVVTSRLTINCVIKICCGVIRENE